MKWADYIITAVKFREEKRHIEQVKIHKDDGEKLGATEIVPREWVISAIEQKFSFVTAYLNGVKWVKGDRVDIVVLNSTKFIRTDGNNTEEDNLGELPEF